ncbi:uncharacterized protein LOC111048840 [Nilaparvata lugens]|uniref:uncharacterized protein LOC111048840 n=1 Tax=Nilaparvata lugens TaxID=108931 RepID=UPI00193CDE1D|nr:uncharacterized protein LOC111048840 [Nilaparvata lugens]
MGICLDTERDQNGSEELESKGRGAWFSDEGGIFRYANAATPPEGQFPMQNAGPVKFEPPNVPVIFVLGGPGSGKVTHCDNLTQEKRGIVHINMTDLLQQYTIGNDMKDFSQLSSRTVTEVLMLEMKMSPAAKTYLVSGYPRNMRDVVEYSDKIETVNGVVVVAWRQRVLERQIDYGAKLGHVVLSLARMELANFFKNVMPVADYFDQRGMVIAHGHTTSGPGSNKAALCGRVAQEARGWTHISVGRMLRAAADKQLMALISDEQELTQLRQAIANGEMAPAEMVERIVDEQIASNSTAAGVLLDGYPRDIAQVEGFEEKYEQQPTLLLLDCSKLQLGRGRLDDSIAAFRRRLHLFRECTLPMLKALDDHARLVIVDGDTDSPQVQDEFCQKLLQEIERLSSDDTLAPAPPPAHEPLPNGVLPRGRTPLHHEQDTTIHDLELDDEEHHKPAPEHHKPAPVHHKAKGGAPKGVANGYGPPSGGISDISKTFAAYNKGGTTAVPNGHVPNHVNQHYPMDSNM